MFLLLQVFEQSLFLFESIEKEEIGALSAEGEKMEEAKWLFQKKSSSILRIFSQQPNISWKKE